MWFAGHREYSLSLLGVPVTLLYYCHCLVSPIPVFLACVCMACTLSTRDMLRMLHLFCAITVFRIWTVCVVRNTASHEKVQSCVMNTGRRRETRGCATLRLEVFFLAVCWMDGCRTTFFRFPAVVPSKKRQISGRGSVSHLSCYIYLFSASRSPSTIRKYLLFYMRSTKEVG